MKAQKIVLSIFVLALPFLSAAQQAQRPTPPEEVLEIQRGELANFDNYVYRFETAHQENDLQSMEDIRVELLKIMEDEVEELEKRHTDGKALQTQLARRELQKSLSKDFKNAQLNVASRTSTDDRPDFLAQLSQFREQMNFEINDLEAALKSNRHD